MAHDDHLKEPQLERVRGTATGIFYKGVGAVMRPDRILIARDLASLRALWGALTDIPLNEGATYPLAVFAERDTKEQGQ